MPVTYPFDPTGEAVTNLITAEQHVATEANYRDYLFIIPDFAPFFVNNLKVYHSDGNVSTLLQQGIDYNCVLPYISAQRSIGIPIYGGISLNNLNLSGIIGVTYQTLGGSWTSDKNYVLQYLAERAYNPRLTIWELVTNIQELFPPINHDHNADYVFGQAELIAAIIRIEQAIINFRNESSTIRHLVDVSNPHETTKTQVGLGDVPNLPLAQQAEIEARVPVDKLVTLRQVLSLIG